MRQFVKILFILIIVSTARLSGQDYPVYSQYLLDGLVLNPAYAGAREALSANISMRKKMMSFDGAPLMGTFSLHSPMKNERVALGIMANYQTYGVTKRSSVYAQYAFRIKTDKGSWAFGLKAGAVMVNNDYTGINLIDPTDPAFTGSVSSYTLPNFGAGAYYFSKKIFLGVSIPELFSYKENSNKSGYVIDVDTGFYKKNYFLGTAGALFSFSDSFKFKPSVLARYSINNPLFLDINATFILADMIWLGASWRMGEDVLVGIFEIAASQQLKIGYAYEYSMGDLSSFVGGTHEIGIRFEFGKKVSAANPRYF